MQVISNIAALFTQENSHTGGSIGGDAAKAYRVTIVDGAAVFSIQGCVKKNGYADAEWFQGVAIPTGANRICYSRTLQFDSDYALFSQADEEDLILTDAEGNRYNGSTDVLTASGELQVGQGSGGWQNTGLFPGPYPVDLPIAVSTYYAFDFVKKTISVLGVGIGARLYEIPAAFQNQPALPSTWKDFNEVVIQEQMGLNQKAQQYTKAVSNASLTFDQA
jgi:hypothetical protein